MESEKTALINDSLTSRSCATSWRYMPTVWKTFLVLLILLGAVSLIVLAVLVARLPRIVLSPSGTCVDKTPQDLLPQIQGMWRENRMRLLSFFNGTEHGLIYLKGKATTYRNTDVEYLFRQEPNFMYVSGMDYADCELILDIATQNLTVFVPVPDSRFAIYNGFVLSLEALAKKYDIDQVLYTANMSSFLAAARQRTDTIFLFDNRTVAPDNNKENFTLNTTYLSRALTLSRSIKSAKELLVMQMVANLSSTAHRNLMAHVKPGYWEYQVSSLFQQNTSFCGLRQQAYETIVGSGPNSAILHYVTLSRQIRQGDLVLVDAGGEWMGYGTDITRTFPANGTFTADQRTIYSIVLAAQEHCIDALRSNVTWGLLNNISSLTILEGLLNANFVKGSLDELFQANVSRIFMPHSLGHSVGQDVHDPFFYSVRLHTLSKIKTYSLMFFSIAPVRL
jgi:Xaa-Pro dipeptidase